MNQSENIRILKSCGAFLEGHFLLSSGRHSAGYCQCAQLLKNPALAANVIASIAEQVAPLNIKTVCGPAMGGIIVSYELARQLGVESIFTERKDNEMCLRRGFVIEPGERVLISEDVVTTGKSTMETVRVLEALGANVVGVAAIADRRADECELTLPVFAAVRLNIESYSPDDCPLCKSGEIPLVKPGSRKS